MTDCKPDLVKMAREALVLSPAETKDADRLITIGEIRYAALRALARAVIDQLGPKPVKVAGWVVIDKNWLIITGFTTESEAQISAQHMNSYKELCGPYRVIYVTGEEGKGPE